MNQPLCLLILERVLACAEKVPSLKAALQARRLIP
jgi:hypothetical protein